MHHRQQGMGAIWAKPRLYLCLTVGSWYSEWWRESIVNWDATVRHVLEEETDTDWINMKLVSVMIDVKLWYQGSRAQAINNRPTLPGWPGLNFKFSSCNLLKWTYLGVVYFLLLYCSFQKFSERLMWLFDELFLAIKVILRWIIKILNKSVNCTWDNQENNHQVLQLSQSSPSLSPQFLIIPEN